MQANFNPVIPGRVAPAHPPIRVKAKVKRWLESKAYGFLDASPTEPTVIFIHAKYVPVRMGIGHRLIEGEDLTVTYTQLDDGRLRALKVEFCEQVKSPSRPPTINPHL